MCYTCKHNGCTIKDIECKTGSTKNLFSYLYTHHPALRRKMEKETNQASALKRKYSEDDNKKSKKCKQSKVEDIFKLQSDNPRSKALTEAIARMMVLDYQP